MKSLLVLLSFIFAVHVSGQELCDDAIDNDGDGLIDLNDDDCICETAIPSGLIPNPSFEEYTICPFNEEQLIYAVSWIQASEATSDFIHTCGDFLGNFYANNAEAPLPFPDGNGCIGFRDGNVPNRPNFKEYVGSALTEPMKVGTTYKLDFFVGFHDHPSSVRFPMAVFLTDDASRLPFGIGNSNFGCPTNGPGWDLIGELVVEGKDEWVNVEFEFTPTKEYEAIVLGPGCETHPDWREEPYFFMDRLALAELSEFNVPTQIVGDICDDLLTIELQPDQLGYQWYHEGIALIGETERFLQLTGSSEEGNYIAVVETSEGCFFSSNYNLSFPPQEYRFREEICTGEFVEFAGQQLLSSGEYRDTSTIGLLCDSIAILELIVHDHASSDDEAIFCTGETFSYEGLEFTQGGDYQIDLETIYGCDSTVLLYLIEVDTAVVYATPTQEICTGETIVVNNMVVSSEGIYLDTTYLDTGCDSISEFELRINQNTEGFLADTLCAGEELTLNSVVYTSGGQYETKLMNVAGCDSTLFLDIFEAPAVRPIKLSDTINIALGEFVDLIPDVGFDVVRTEWFLNDLLISEERNLLEILPLKNEIYRLRVFNVFDCVDVREVTIEVDSHVSIYIPNVISKSSINNDAFVIGTNLAVRDISDLRIYDRWGELVYRYSGTMQDYTGWDGRFRNGYVEQGVYTYVAEFVVVDETIILKSGNLTLLR